MTFRLLPILLTCLATASAPAAIVDIARFKLGESGSLVAPDNRPVDSLSTDMLTVGIAGGGTPTGSAVAPGSTDYINLGPGIQGWYGASGSGVFGAGTLGAAPDNFGLEIFVNAVAGQGDNVFLTTTGTTLANTGGLLFEIRSGNWSVAVPGNDFIGSIVGAGQPATPGWTSLAVIRHSGVSTLYINGVAQPRTTTVQPDFSTSLHLGVTPGGASWFQGGMDEMHIFTFAPTDNPASFLTAVPEPSTAMVLGLAALGLVSRRRRA